MAEDGMAEDAVPATEAPKKRSKLPILLGLVLMALLGGGGFYVTYSGLLFASGGAAQTATDPAVESVADVAFVPIDPLVISLDPSARSSHLRFSAQLEVDKAHRGEVTTLMPRVLDVLNSYLRAVEVSDLEDPSALVRLRAQMLRRVQIVTGEGRVRDLLVTEFVLN
jgi:flagellar FliL protein